MVDVRGPDGIITRFPDGTPDATIDQVMTAAYAPKPAPTRETSATGAFARGVGDSASMGFGDEMAGIGRALFAPGASLKNFRQNYESGRDVFRSTVAADEAQHPNARLAGQVTGAVALPMGKMQTLGQIVGKGAAYGAGYGAGSGEGDVASRAKSAATGAAAGAIGGAVGAGVTRGLARVVAPKGNDAAKLLRSEGVELTMGQAGGKLAKQTEDVLSGAWVAGAPIKGAQRRSIETFNRAAVNRALKSIGQTLPDTVESGHDAVRHAGDVLSKSYQDLLPKLNATIDPTLVSRVAALRKAVNLAPPQAARFEQFIQNDVQRAFDQATGKATGRALKTLDEKLGKAAADYKAAPDPDARALGDALTDLQGHLRGLVRRANPAAAKKLRDVDAGWANLIRVESAARNAADGIFTPKQLMTAVRQTDRSGRKRATARGTALMQDLAKAGSEVLPSTVPDSGTAGRLLGLLALGDLTGTIGTTAAVGGGAAGLSYTRPAQRAIVKAISDRPQGAQKLGDLIRRAQVPVAAAGAGGAVAATNARR